MMTSSFISLLGLTKFTQAFLRLDEQMPFLVRIINIYILAYAVSTIITHFFGTPLNYLVWRLLTAVGIALPAIIGALSLWRGIG